MCRNWNPLQRRAYVSLLACLVATGVAWAEDVVEIEEHWTLAVGGPDGGKSSPQVTMTMSPTEDLLDDYFLVLLNHELKPAFAAGGVQVQHYHGSSALCYESIRRGDKLNHDGETISWTQRLRLQDNQLIFEVVDGSSESWGSFGDGGKLRIEMPSSLERLNAYKPAISISESGISYAGNRVSSLVLQKLWWKTSDGVEHELLAPIDIDSDLDP